MLAGDPDLSAGFRMDDYWVWGASPTRDEQGTYHLFASAWSRQLPFSPCWLTHSQIVRAEASRPEGPYRFKEVILPPRDPKFWDGRMTHNPAIQRHGETWLLFYTGSSFPEDPDDYNEMCEEGDRKVNRKSRAHQRIGLATAPSPAGPWTRPDHPILEPRPGLWDGLMTTNPAPYVREDGSVLLLYKSVGHEKDKMRYGVAGASHWSGTYERLQENPLEWLGDGQVEIEDATLWQHEGNYHLIFKDQNGSITGEKGCGVHAVSPDGLNWSLADPVKVYSRQLAASHDLVPSGVLGSRERPQVFIDHDQATGETSLWVFNAVADGPGGFSNADHTWNSAAQIIQ